MKNCNAHALVQAVDFNGTYYYCLRNGQGDIVKLIDGSGTTVVEYTYDSWGKKLSCTGTLATTLGVLNPFRYRGYVYDEETGFYYLKSRYYDPVTCRFISADVLLSTGQGVLGHNCYAYCLNNPIKLKDSAGKEAYDEFDSEEEALRDFYNNYAEESRKDQLEYFTILHKKTSYRIGIVWVGDAAHLGIIPKETYYYEKVQKGGHGDVVINYLLFSFQYLKGERPGFGRVAMIHTHPAPTDGSCKHLNKDGTTYKCNPEGLSEGDYSSIRAPWMYAVYAVLPDGRVFGAKKDILWKTIEVNYDFSK